MTHVLTCSSSNKELRGTPKATMDQSSLCLACGICCDGTLFSNVKLKPHDEIAPLQAAGIVLDSDAKNFQQPCAAHKNCACTVYSNRPQTCQSYQCELLKRFGSGDTLHETALAIIKKAVSLKSELKNAMALAVTDIQSAEAISSLLKSWGQDPKIGAAHQTYAPLFLKFMVLQLYLDRFFRKKPVA